MISKKTALLIIAAVGVLIYSNTLQAQFMFDDLSIIVSNPKFMDVRDIGTIFSFDPTRFVTHFSFAFNNYLHGENVVGYHLVNIFFHCLNAFLLYIFVRLICQVLNFREQSSSTALLSALIFLAHPLQTQAVTYTVQRSVLLASACYLLSMIVYVKLRQNFKWSLYALLCLVNIIGCMTKPIFVTVPMAVFLIEIIFLRNKLEKAERPLLLCGPYFVVLLIIPYFLYLFMFNTLSIKSDVILTDYLSRLTTKISRSQYLFTQFEVVSQYIKLLVFPINQNVDYEFPIARGFWSIKTAASFMFLFTIFCAGLWTFKRNQIASFSILWFFVLLIPESSIFPLPDVIFEHRAYLIVGAFGILAAYLFNFFIDQKRVRFTAAAFVLIVLSILTYQRNYLWAHPSRLLHDIVKKSPYNPRARNQLGYAFESEGKLDAAIKQYRKAVQLDPFYIPAYINLGNLYAKQEDLNSAITAFKQAATYEPGNFYANFNLGIAYAKSGQHEFAYAQFKKTIEMRPKEAGPYYQMGKMYSGIKQYAYAEQYYQRAVSNNPHMINARYELGNVYLNLKDYPKAIHTYTELIKRAPNYLDAYNTLGIAYINSGQKQLAEQAFIKALSMGPEDITVHRNLASFYNYVGDQEKHKYYASKIKELNPKDF